jgi:hypothetical protein
MRQQPPDQKQHHDDGQRDERAAPAVILILLVCHTRVPLLFGQADLAPDRAAAPNRLRLSSDAPSNSLDKSLIGLVSPAGFEPTTP